MARKKKEEEHENHERWLVSYADFITLLFAFFVVMYSVSMINEGKLRAAADAISKAFNPIQAFTATPLKIDPKVTEDISRLIPPPNIKVYEQIQQALKEMGDLGDKVTVSIEKRGIVIRVAETVIFDPGKAEIRGEAIRILNKVGSILGGLDNHIRVEGHTDNIPIKTAHYPSNWELSTDRASTIVRYFIGEVKVEPFRFSAGGYAEYRPIDSNKTPEGRGKNRRVDIVIMNEQESAQEPS